LWISREDTKQKEWGKNNFRNICFWRNYHW
jgi:hypothetical protein